MGLNRLLDLDVLEDSFMADLMIHPKLGPIIKREMGYLEGLKGLVPLEIDNEKHGGLVKQLLVQVVFESKTGVSWDDYQDKFWTERKCFLKHRPFNPDQLVRGTSYKELKMIVGDLKATNVNDLYRVMVEGVIRAG